MRTSILAIVAAAVATAMAVSEDSWQVKHMKSEHGFDNFDALSFFKLHDADRSNTWTGDDILNLYGLQNKNIQVGDGTGMGKMEETKEISDETKNAVVKQVLALIDINKDGVISLDEWRIFTDKGGELPDFGLGPGHHGDYEYEYEVHHWQEYHMKDDPDVKIVHPEDEEHERLYHAFEHGDDEQAHAGTYEKVDRIPAKYRRN